MKTLVAYFSASGTTKMVANRLAGAIGADIFEIEPKIPYSNKDLDWTDENSRSSLEMKNGSSRPEVANMVLNIEQYDKIFVGFPIWWYVAPTIINSFLEQYDLSGKTIVPFATSGGSGMGETNKHLAPSCKGAVLKDGKRFATYVSEEGLKAWASQF